MASLTREFEGGPLDGAQTRVACLVSDFATLYLGNGERYYLGYN